MIIIRNKWTSLLLGKSYLAMCLHPFLLVRLGYDIRTMPQSLNHEQIHARQQMEMLWVLFFLWYTAEYLVRLTLTLSHGKAYRSISFEQEAYHHQGDPDYLTFRKRFSWFKYLI